MLTRLNKILFLSLVLVLAGSIARAAEVTFPISELGNCASKTECATYCDAISHKDACLTYASTHNLVDKKVVDRQKQIIQLIKTVGGPGGCTTQDSCHAYCDQESNQQECHDFALSHQLIQDTDQRPPQPDNSSGVQINIGRSKADEPKPSGSTKPLPLAPNSQVPPALRPCLEKLLGKEATDQLAGTTKTKELEDKIRPCLPSPKPDGTKPQTSGMPMPPKPDNIKPPTSGMPMPPVMIPPEWRNGGATNAPTPKVSAANTHTRPTSLFGLMLKILLQN